MGTLEPMDSFGFAFQAMSSSCEVRLDGDDEGTLAVAAKQAIDEVQRIESKYSRYRADSIVSRINAAAGRRRAGRGRRRDRIAARLRGQAARAQRRPVRHHLGRAAPRLGLPCRPRSRRGRAASPAAADRLVAGAAGSGSASACHAPGMELDFGGFGKEYAADRAMAILAGAGHATWLRQSGRRHPRARAACRRQRLALWHPAPAPGRRHDRQRRHAATAPSPPAATTNASSNWMGGATATSSIHAPAGR